MEEQKEYVAAIINFRQSKKAFSMLLHWQTEAKEEAE